MVKAYSNTNSDPRGINLRQVRHDLSPWDFASDFLSKFKFHQRKGSTTATLVKDFALLRDVMADIETELVQDMRADGASWTEVGDVFGISRQGARQRFGGAGIR